MQQELESLELEKLSSDKHKDTTFELISVMDLLTHQNRPLYRVLFKPTNQDLKFYIIELIAPELLIYFPTGGLFKNSKLIDYKEPPTKKEFSMDGVNYEFHKLGTVLSNSEQNFNHSIYFKKTDTTTNFSIELKDQFCIVFKSEEDTVILPCSLIGTRFYFTSTNMRLRMFDSTPESQYYKLKQLSKRVFKIWLKPGVAYNDAENIVHFQKNRFAQNSLATVKKSFVAKKYRIRNNTHIPLPMHLPFEKKIRFYANVKQVSKNKYLVQEIYDYEEIYDFDEIQVVPAGSSESNNTSAKPSIPQNNSQKNKKMEHRPPSSLNTFAGIRNHYKEEDIQYPKVNVTFLDPEGESEASKNNHHQKDNGETSVSPLEPESSGDEDLSHLNSKPLAKPKKKKPKKPPDRCNIAFTVGHFEAIFNKIKKDNHVLNSIMSLSQTYPKRLDGKKSTEKECSSKLFDTPRKIYLIKFKYKNFFCNILDIDQKGLSNGSSIIVYLSPTEIPYTNIVTFLRKYAKGDTFKNIQELLSDNSVYFYRKNHPCPRKSTYAQDFSSYLLDNLESKYTDFTESK